MASQSSAAHAVERWLAVALCAAVAAAGVLEHLVPAPPSDLPAFGPGWLPLAAAALGALGMVPVQLPRWPGVQRALLWSGLLLLVWAANGLPLDLLRLTPLMPFPIDWPGLMRKTLALAAAILLARAALARPATPARTRPATWYGYAAFLLALPYPVLRIFWAFGATPGLGRPGAGGEGFAPLLIAIPWVLAAALSLLLVKPRPGIPRLPLLAAGWTATTIVAMIGPAAVWALFSAWVSGKGVAYGEIAPWVFTLFYGSWFLWALAAAAATRSYQLRTTRPGDVPGGAEPAPRHDEPRGVPNGL